MNERHYADCQQLWTHLIPPSFTGQNKGQLKSPLQLLALAARTAAHQERRSAPGSRDRNKMVLGPSSSVKEKKQKASHSRAPFTDPLSLLFHVQL